MSEITEPKKRGRKPKPKTEEPVNSPKLKKRGRKPKCCAPIITENVIHTAKPIMSNNTILSLPIKIEKNKKSNIDESNKNELQNDKLHEEKDQNIVPETESTESTQLSCIHHDKNSITKCEECVNEFNKNYQQKVQEEIIIEKSDTIPVFKDTIQDTPMQLDNIEYIPYNNTKKEFSTKINDLQEDHERQNYHKVLKNNDLYDYEISCTIKPYQTLENDNNIYYSNCWWDTYSFNTTPIPLPISYDSKKNKFKVTGCFCSFECMLAYKMNAKYHSIHTDTIQYFYKKCTNGTNNSSTIKIKKAPPREALERFGGPLSIQRFREISKDPNIKYEIIFPPLTVINPMYIESKKQKNTNYKLKRSKPLPISQ